MIQTKTILESSERIIAGLKSGMFQEHIPAETLDSIQREAYLAGYERMLQSRNCRYIMMCEGIEA